MKEFKGGTAVITGAANGIGRALAKECARRGMNVVMADIDMGNLAQAEEEVRALGARTLAVRCDVTELDDWQALAKASIDTFGTVELLFSNAGVTALGDIVNIPEIDFDFCMQTNLYGTFYALKTFVPSESRPISASPPPPPASAPRRACRPIMRPSTRWRACASRCISTSSPGATPSA